MEREEFEEHDKVKHFFKENSKNLLIYLRDSADKEKNQFFSALADPFIKCHHGCVTPERAVIY